MIFPWKRMEESRDKSGVEDTENPKGSPEVNWDIVHWSSALPMASSEVLKEHILSKGKNREQFPKSHGPLKYSLGSRELLQVGRASLQRRTLKQRPTDTLRMDVLAVNSMSRQICKPCNIVKLCKCKLYIC